MSPLRKWKRIQISIPRSQWLCYANHCWSLLHDWVCNIWLPMSLSRKIKSHAGVHWLLNCFISHKQIRLWSQPYCVWGSGWEWWVPCNAENLSACLQKPPQKLALSHIDSVSVNGLPPLISNSFLSKRWLSVLSQSVYVSNVMCRNETGLIEEGHQD